MCSLELHTIGVSPTAASTAQQPSHVAVVQSGDGDFPMNGISLKYLHQFAEACGGPAALVGLSTQDVCTKFIIPSTTHTQSSACDTLLSFGRLDVVSKATWFVSHVWRYPFLDVLDALDSFFSDQDHATTFIWFDLFTNSQHNTSKRPVDWWKTTFMNAVKTIRNFVVVLQPWDNPDPLTRAWCVFELYACHLTNSNFNVAMTRAEEQRFAENVSTDFSAFYKMLATIQSRNATAMSLSDRDDIFKVIEESTGFNELDRLLFDVFGKWMQEKLLVRIESAQGDVEIVKWKLTLGSLYEDQGQYEMAEPLYVDCIEKCKRCFGDDHPETLSSINCLALLFSSQGHYDKAEPLLDDCVQKAKRAFGEYDPQTLSYLSNIALIFSNQGLYDKAETLYVDCLERTKHVLGEEHMDTINCTLNLAHVFYHQGAYGKAEPLYVNCLERTKITLGEEHPDTLASIDFLARLFSKQGFYEKAEPLYTDCLEERQRILGKDHPDTLNSVNNLALLYKNQKRFDKAEAMYGECLERRKRILGEDHPATLTSLNNLASLYDKQGLYDRAEPLYADCLERQKRTLGENHPSTLSSLNNLAFLYDNQGFYDKAEPMYIDCIERKKHSLGEDHPSFLTTLNHLAFLYDKQGFYEKAELVYVDLIEKQKLYLGEDHSSTVMTMNNYAKMCEKASSVKGVVGASEKDKDVERCIIF